MPVKGRIVDIPSLLRRVVRVERHEISALFWSCSYFFALLCSYYIIRPVRDEMGILGGVENLQWLFTATFVAMLAVVPLFGWVTSRFPRKRFLPYVYLFFISHIIVFFLFFKSDVSDAYIARIFFVWVSVFNLFIVSVFWSFMTDIYSNGQAKRLFGFIAAGGTIGALFGPILTTALAVPLGLANLLLVSALFLGWALLCVNRLIVWQDAGRVNESDATESDSTSSAERALGGTIWAGIRLVVSSPYLIGICVLMLLFTTLATFLYFQQAEIVRDSFSDSSQRTSVFAAIDLAVNLLTILLQVFLTGRLVKWLGLGWTLAIVPLALAAGFGLLALFPTLGVLVLVQVTRRAGNYAITRPAREMLYVVLDREEKYKAKNFIDTVVYRGGDAVSAWIYSGLRGLGLGLSAIAWLAVPIACVWAWIAFRLGQRQEEIAVKQQLEQSRASSRS